MEKSKKDLIEEKVKTCNCKICKDEVMSYIVKVKHIVDGYTPNKVFTFLKENGFKISENTVRKHIEVCLKDVKTDKDAFIKIEMMKIYNYLIDGKIGIEDIAGDNAVRGIILQNIYLKKLQENPMNFQANRDMNGLLGYLKDLTDDYGHYTHKNMDKVDELTRNKKMEEMKERMGRSLKNIKADEKIPYLKDENKEEDKTDDVMRKLEGEEDKIDFNNFV